MVFVAVLDKLEADGFAGFDLEDDCRAVKCNGLERRLVQRPQTHWLLTAGPDEQFAIFDGHFNFRPMRSRSSFR
jgi:hypothetical protein